MKKFLIILMGLLLIGCAQENKLIEIKYQDWEKKLEKKETFILYIGAQDCPFCTRYEKVLKRVMNEYKVEVHYINIDDETMTLEEKKGLNDIVNYSGTPTTVFIKGGVVGGQYNRISGYTTSEKVIKAFTKNGYIK